MPIDSTNKPQRHFYHENILSLTMLKFGRLRTQQTMNYEEILENIENESYSIKNNYYKSSDWVFRIYEYLIRNYPRELYNGCPSQEYIKFAFDDLYEEIQDD